MDSIHTTTVRDIEDFYYDYIHPDPRYRRIIYRDLSVLHRLYNDGILYSDNEEEYRAILRNRVYLKWDTCRIVSLNLSGLLSGEVPEYIDQLFGLKYLFITECNLDHIPDFLGQLPELYHLYLDNNPIQYNVNEYIDQQMLLGMYKNLYILSTDQALIYID